MLENKSAEAITDLPRWWSHMTLKALYLLTTFCWSLHPGTWLWVLLPQYGRSGVPATPPPPCELVARGGGRGWTRWATSHPKIQCNFRTITMLQIIFLLQPTQTILEYIIAFGSPCGWALAPQLPAAMSSWWQQQLNFHIYEEPRLQESNMYFAPYR